MILKKIDKKIKKLREKNKIFAQTTYSRIKILLENLNSSLKNFDQQRKYYEVIFKTINQLTQAPIKSLSPIYPILGEFPNKSQVKDIIKDLKPKPIDDSSVKNLRTIFAQ